MGGCRGGFGGIDSTLLGRVAGEERTRGEGPFGEGVERVLRPAANRPSPAARRGSLPTLPRRVESVGLADWKGPFWRSPARARAQSRSDGTRNRHRQQPRSIRIGWATVDTHRQQPRSILIGWATNGRMFATVFRSTMSLAPLKHHRRLRACIDTHRGCSRIRRGLECCDRLRSRAPLR